jgi:CRP-like cAMP-binding protein
LPAPEFERLRPDLISVPATERQVFHRLGERLEYVYFPNSGVASIITVLTDGRMVETATVGWEGMIGFEALLSGNPVSQGEALLQVAGTTLEKLSVKELRSELSRHGALDELLGRYATAMVRQMMQSTACNALHQVEQRCARWLLMTHDRVDSKSFKLSHEFLSMMLGVTRPSVSIVAGKLQAEGLIAYGHGVVRIVDRAGLEATTCECYELIRQGFDSVSSPRPDPPPQ